MSLNSEQLLRERIEDAKRRGRELREQRTADLRRQEEEHERLFRVAREAIEARAEQVIQGIPDLILNAEKWDKREASVLHLMDSDFSRAITAQPPRLVGSAKVVFDRCELLGLSPAIEEKSDSCLECPDAGTHREIVISWE